MARTKASVISREETETSNKDKKKSHKRKDRSETPDTSKKKKVKKEEIIADVESDGEELLCDPLPEVAQQFYRGTTWPLDASLEVHVQYEGVKEARTIKPQFFPLLFQLTRGDPDSIAKAITAIKPVYKILTERFEKEHKASDTGSTSQTLKSEPTTPQSINITQADILKKLPRYRFRDKNGKWLPKSQWKVEEIIKKNSKLQSLLFGIESSKETKEITELCDAKAAIENILSRVTFNRQCYAQLLVWMRNLEMKSYGSPKQKQKSAHPQKKENKTEAKKAKEVNDKKPVSVPKSVPNKALYGLEESAIISDKRLRDRPKFAPFIPPKQDEGKSKGGLQSSSSKKMMSYSPQSAAMKKYVKQSSSYAVQQSKSSRSLSEKSGSSRGYSVLFKGRTFSSGKKIYFNRNRNSQSESDTESKYEESDSSSTTSSYTHDRRKNVSKSWGNQNDGSKTKRTIMSKAHRNSLSTNSSELGQCDSQFLSDLMDEESPVGKSDVRVKSCALLPKVRVSKLTLSDVKMLTSPQEEQKKSVSVNYSEVHSSQENKVRVKSHSQQNEALIEVDSQQNEVDIDYTQQNEALIEADSQQNEVYIDYTQQNEALVEADSQQNEVYIDTAQQNEDLIEANSQENQVSVDTSSQQNFVSELRISEVKSLAPQKLADEADELPRLLYFGDEVSSTPEKQVNHGESSIDNGAQKAGSSTNNDTSKDSSNSSQPSTAEETLRLLISQLTNSTKDKGEPLDCKLVFSNSNHVLSIGERSNSQGGPSVDIKPNVDEIRLKENPTTAEAEKAGNSDSSVVRVKEERVESNAQWAGLRTQNEAEPIIVIDSDDE